ncbi:MAG: LD-carboxypeptidase [Candidatus Liptonbacteria bacterium]|nr:LD-carboxypeptidase [Candidatus Liptonbacteria bacterium]
MFPEKLKVGDKIAVIAPALSIAIINKETRGIANQRFKELGLELVFGKHVEEIDEFTSSSIESRIADLHEAFRNPEIKGIVSVIGGFNSNQLLRYIDWELIKNNPKIFWGYSDITAMENATYAKTGLVTYSSPAYSTFGQKLYFEYTLEYFKKCLFEDKPFEIRPSEIWTNDDLWWENQDARNPISNSGPYVINEGEAEGTILGANLCTFNLLQGTEYFPDFKDSILFIEDDGNATPQLFDRDLQSLIHQPGFQEVKGVVIGRFEKKSQMTREKLTAIIQSKKELDHMPVIADADFGHTQPMITFPIGGESRISASLQTIKIEIIKH